MKKQSLLILIAVFIAAITCVSAQTIPSNFVRKIGYTNPTGATQTMWTYPAWNPVGPYATLGVAAQNTAIDCEFPPIQDNDRGRAIFVYRSWEVGLPDVYCKINKLRIPIHKDPNASYAAAGYPYDLYYQFFNNYNSATYRAYWPTHVTLHMKNGAAFTTRAEMPVDTSYANGWRKVWDDEFFYFSDASRTALNTQQFFLSGDTLFLELTFDEPFEYTGGDISLIFSNLGKTTETTIGDPTACIYHNGAGLYVRTVSQACSYRMQCYGLYFNASLPDSIYSGPLFSYSNRLLCSYGPSTNAAGASVGYYMWGSIGGSTDPDTNNYIGGSIYTNVSIKPRAHFYIPLMNIENTIAVDAEPTGIDNQYIMQRFNVVASERQFALRMKSLTFAKTGTGTGVTVDKATLYRLQDGNYSQKVQLAVINNPGTGNLTFNFLDTLSKHTNQSDTNQYCIVYEIPNTNKCGDQLGISISSYVVDRCDGEIVSDAIDHIVNVTFSNTNEVQYDRVNLVNNDDKVIPLCYEEGDPTYTLHITGVAFGGFIYGTYYGYQWYSSNNNGATWNLISGATNEAYTFTKDLNTTMYKGVVTHPEGCESLDGDLDNVVYTINYEQTNKSVSINYTGDFTPAEQQKLQGNDILTFTSTLVQGANSRPVYRWQVNYNNAGWSDFLKSPDALTATYTVPIGRSGSIGIRLMIEVVDQVPACQCTTTVISEAINFNAELTEYTFDFTPIDINPTDSTVIDKKNIFLCKDASITLSCAFSGEIILSQSCWQKDGTDYLVNGDKITDRYLTITKANDLTPGLYYYKAFARVTVPNPDGTLRLDSMAFYSDTFQIYLYPYLEIYDITPSQNYAMPNTQVSFKVESSYANNVISNHSSFQWYRARKGAGETPVVDNGYFKGAKSNLLVISVPPTTDPNASSVYSYNGDYYFLKIIGGCDSLDTKNNPIYLNPGTGLSIKTNLTNNIICNLGDDATFAINADATDLNDIAYRWYMDGVQLTDNGRILGAATSNLTISNVQASDLALKIYCYVYLKSDPTIWVNSNEVELQERFLIFDSKYPTTDTIHATLGTIIRFSIAWKANNVPSPYLLQLKDIEEDNYIFNSTIPNTTVTSAQFQNVTITQDDLDKYSVKHYTVTVSDVCGNTFTATWVVLLENADDDGDSKTGVDENATIIGLAIDPNPVTDIVSVSFNSNTEATTSIELCSLTGSTITSLYSGIANIGMNTQEFNLSKLNLATGTYIIKVSNTKGTMAKQFLFIK